MVDEEKVKGENEGVELDDEVLEDVSGGESTEDNNNNNGTVNNVTGPVDGGS